MLQWNNGNLIREKEAESMNGGRVSSYKQTRQTQTQQTAHERKSMMTEEDDEFPLSFSLSRTLYSSIAPQRTGFSFLYFSLWWRWVGGGKWERARGLDWIVLMLS
jgi:hypothetical protein